MANRTGCQLASVLCRSLWIPLFTGAIPWPTPTTPSILIHSLTLNHLDHSFTFNNEIITNKTTNEITTAHCSVPMLKRPSD